MASKASCKRSGISSGEAHDPGLGCHGRGEEQLRGREDREGGGVQVREAGAGPSLVAVGNSLWLVLRRECRGQGQQQPESSKEALL